MVPVNVCLTVIAHEVEKIFSVAILILFIFPNLLPNKGYGKLVHWEGSTIYITEMISSLTHSLFSQRGVGLHSGV